MDRFSAGESSPSWKKDLYVLDGISALIMIRSIVSVIEYVMGQKGYLLSHEWAMHIFSPFFSRVRVQPGSSRRVRDLFIEEVEIHLDFFNGTRTIGDIHLLLRSI